METSKLASRVLDLERGRMVVTGPPGAGKTTLLRERYGRLIRSGVTPERIGLLVLSRRAVREAREVLLRAARLALPELPVFTAHGFAYRVVGSGFDRLGYEDEPEVLSAPEQYAAVRDMLSVERQEDWPRFGRLLQVPSFAKQVADFVLRSQERLLTPEDVEKLVDSSGRDEYREVGRFYRRYLDAMSGAGQVDFGGLLVQAVSLLSTGATVASFDHVLVDDYQDVTLATEAIVASLTETATSVVVAADPEGHVFSYRGGSLAPLRRIDQTVPGIEHVELSESHRLGPRVNALARLADPTAEVPRDDAPAVDARLFAHPGEEAEAVAHELLRLRVDEDVAWGDMAIVLRRYGGYLTALRHALRRHEVPFVVVAEQATIATEPVIRPVIDLLRYVFRPELRDQLLDVLLGSPIGGFDPHELRALRREARLRDVTLLQLAEGDDAGQPLTDGLGERLAAFHSLVVSVAGADDRFEPLDALFFRLWTLLPYFRGLVAAENENRRELDAVSAFAATLARFVERRPEASVEDYLITLDAAEFGPDPWIPPDDRRPDAVRVVSAHRAQGREFEAVIVAGCLEGEFPSLAHRASLVSIEALVDPMSPVERFADRLAEERALFRLAVSRSRRPTLLFASRSTGSRTPQSPSRFAARLGSPWHPAEAGPGRPATSLRGMEAELRGRLASSDAPARSRLAAALALPAVGAEPDRWWGRRDWTDGGASLFEEELRTSYSRLSVMENCALQYLFAVELGLDPEETYQMWLGSLVHGIIDRVQRGEIERDHDAMCAALDTEWRPEAFPNEAIEHRRYLDARDMLFRWLNFEHNEPLESEVWFEFPIDGAILRGRIDAVFPMENGHLRVVDYKTSRYPITDEQAKTDLQLAAYYLAVKRTPELAALGPPGYLQLAYLGKGNQRDGFARRGVSPKTIPNYEQNAEERIHELLGRIRREDFAPNPGADCQWCAFRSICPRWPEGGEVALEGGR